MCALLAESLLGHSHQVVPPEVRSASRFFPRIARDADWGSGLYPLGVQGTLLRGRYWGSAPQSTTAAQDCCVRWTSTPGWALLREADVL